MAYTILREQARILRQRDGLSLKEIGDKLKVGKTTVSYWCRDIKLTKLQITRLIKIQKEFSLKGSIEYSEKIKDQRIKRESEFKRIGKSDVGDLSKRDLFILGIGLYWAEGCKKGNTEVAFTNSDPAMVSIIIDWFTNIYGIKKEDFIFRISINNIHKDRERKVIDFWKNHLDVPISQFTKISYIKSVSKKVYLNRDNYYGVLRVKVRRGVNLHSRILGAIEFLSKR